MNIAIGDWVTGHTPNGEFVQGYVEAIDPVGGQADVQVVASDHEAAVGQAIKVRLHRVKRLPVGSMDTPEELRSLIDLALDTRDEEWFRELTGRWAASRSADKTGPEGREAAPPLVRNRLRLYKTG